MYRPDPSYEHRPMTREEEERAEVLRGVLITLNTEDKMRNHTIEREWTTKAGLRAVCLLVNDSHRCGYVEVPAGHKLHGVDYGQHSDALKDAMHAALNGPIGKRGYLSAICIKADECTPEAVFDVHGSLTYAGGGNDYPAKSSGGWWFGFDCAHCDDKTRWSEYGEERTLEYVSDECESLAEQLAAIK